MMKKKMLFLVIPFLLLGLVSCNGEGGDNSSSVSTPVKDPMFEGEWDSELKVLMNDLLKEEIPYVKLADSYEFSKEADSTGEYIYISGVSTTDFVEAYGKYLETQGYAYDSEEKEENENYTYTAYFYTKGNLVIQLDHFPGATINGETYAAANEIYAWLEDDSGSTGDDVGQTTLTAWPTDLLEMMNSSFGKTIPFVALADNFEYSNDEEGVYITDATSTNYLTNYGVALEEAGFAKSAEDNSYGYTIYQYYVQANDDYNLVVEYGFFPGNDYYSAGNSISMYLNQIIKEVKVDAWPSSEIASVMNEKCKLTIPEFAISGQYTYFFYGTGIYVYGTSDSDLSSSYVSSLTAANFLLGYDAYQELDYYYDWEEYVSVYLSYDADEKKFMILIQPTEPQYDELLASFPQDKIATFLGDSAVEVPSFSIAEGETYKYTYQEEFEFLGYTFPASIEIDVKDAGTVGTNALEDTYKALLKEKGWKIDDSQYDDNGYIATSGSVTLTFYTQDGVFSLYIEK